MPFISQFAATCLERPLGWWGGSLVLRWADRTDCHRPSIPQQHIINPFLKTWGYHLPQLKQHWPLGTQTCCSQPWFPGTLTHYYFSCNFTSYRVKFCLIFAFIIHNLIISGKSWNFGFHIVWRHSEKSVTSNFAVFQVHGDPHSHRSVQAVHRRQQEDEHYHWVLIGTCGFRMHHHKAWKPIMISTIISFFSRHLKLSLRLLHTVVHSGKIKLKQAEGQAEKS